MIDYHIHTQHSIDASGTITEYCERALQIGLKEICFTNHCELDPRRNDSFIRFNGEREPLSNHSLEKLQRKVFEARDQFRKKGLLVRFGIEVGYYPGIEERLHEMMRGIDLDFVIGAIHCLDHICIDSSRECNQYFGQYDARQYLTNYIHALSELVRSNLFDSVAHIDVYKKYGRDYYGSAINDVPLEIISSVFRLIKEHDIAMEVNTAGMRFMNEFYPGPSLMQMAREHGLRLITIGSDSHKTADLGKDLKLAHDYLKSFGFKRVFGFDQRKSSCWNI